MSYVPLLVAAVLSSRGEAVVARIDAIPITEAALARRVEGTARAGQQLARSDALDSLVVDVLLSAEASRLGLGPADVAGFVEREVRKAASLALVESFAERREPDEASLRQMFHASADFVRYEFLSYESEEDAKGARQRVDKGASFADEAKSAVVSRLYPKPTDAPVLMRAAITPSSLASALLAASPGAVVGPFADEKGWVLARILQKEIGSDAEFAKRRPALALAFRKQTIDAARGHLVEQLKAKAGVKLDEEFLKSLRGVEASPAQLQHTIAVVDGQPVRYADVHSRIAGLGGRAGHMASAAIKIQLATGLVNERVLESFAVQRGFDKTPEMAALRPELERNGLAALAADKIRASAAPPSKREVEAYYRQNSARYRKPLDEVRPWVTAHAAEQKRADALLARLAELRGKASIWIDGSAVAKAGQ